MNPFTSTIELNQLWRPSRSSLSARTIAVNLSLIISSFFISGCETPTPTPTPNSSTTVERWDFPAKNLPNFGYGLMRGADFAAHYNQARFWPDKRPVLLAPLQFTDMPMHRSMSEIERVIFGSASPKPGEMSSKDYFAHVSLGNVELMQGHVLDVITASVPRSGNTSEIERGAVVQQALDSGIDLTALYDTNHDGTIDDQELLIVTMVADAPNTGGGGAVRYYCQSHTSVDGKRTARFCGRSASFSEYAQFYVVTHELTHIFGSIDLYNLGELGVNAFLSLMAGAGSDNKVYLDPYHRIKLGWIGPRVFDIASGVNTCFSVAPSHRGAVSLEDGKPIVIYDSKRGSQNYLIAEYRRKAGYDRDVIDEGVALWYVHEGTDQMAAPVVIGYVRTSSPSLASTVQGDDQIISAWSNNLPYVLNTGIDMVFNSPRMSPDAELNANGVLNYPPAHFAPGQTSGTPRDRRLGYPKFWNRTEFLNNSLNWYEPYSRAPASLGMEINTADFPSDPEQSIRLDFVVNRSAPLPSQCL